MVVKFGFDLGIASIGWAVIEGNKNRDTVDEIKLNEIKDCGVRCFDSCEVPKTGASLSAVRTAARSARKTTRRRALRMQEIKKLFLKNKILNNAELENLFAGAVDDVWTLRVKALNEKLSKNELCRVLIHIAKHRGYKNQENPDNNPADGKKILAAIANNNKEAENFRTIAEFIENRSTTGENKKKRNGKNIYQNSISRTKIKEEITLIFEQQRDFGNEFASKLLQNVYERIALRQRGTGSVMAMVGNCTHCPDKKRAPIASCSYEKFKLLSMINNLKINDVALNQELKDKIYEYCMTKNAVTFDNILKIFFEGNENIKFNLSEKKKFSEMKTHTKLRKEGILDQYSIEDLDIFVNIIAMKKEKSRIINSLINSKKCNKEHIEFFANLSIKKFGHLSFSALYKLLPHMREGKCYKEACALVEWGDAKSTQLQTLLPALSAEEKTNVPTVNRALSQFRKVYNAMVEQYGKPDYVHLEFARELQHSRDKLNKIKKIQEENKEKNEKLKEKASELGITNWRKLNLYEEQEGKCIYSGETIDIKRLNEVGYCEIDHILPLSRSVNDSINNKVLALNKSNQEKGNKTPHEWLSKKGGNEWEQFEDRVTNMSNINGGKKNNLLMENYSEKEKGFLERNLNDTRYIAVKAKKYIEEHIDFSASETKSKQRVYVVNGRVTAFLRSQWGLTKDREKDDRHHAVDAIVVAFASQSDTQILSSQSAKEGWFVDDKLRERFHQPWDGFRTEVEKVVAEINISRKKNYKVTGQAHEDTITKTSKFTGQGIDVRNGKANNARMVRVDVFSKKNKKDKDEFYLVPVYVVDTVKKELPNKAVLSGKGLITEMDDTYNFKFSLHKNDLIKIDNSDEYFYYRGTDISTGSINFTKLDNAEFKKGEKGTLNGRKGVKKLDVFKKYKIDILGKVIKEVEKEPRLKFNINKKH